MADKKISGIILPGSEDVYRFIPETAKNLESIKDLTNQAADAEAVKVAIKDTVFYKENNENLNSILLDAETLNGKKEEQLNVATANNSMLLEGKTSNQLLENYIQIPKIYPIRGLLINGQNDSIEGYGSAMITIMGNIARIDMSIKITKESSINTFSWGINPNLFHIIDSKIPNITPIDGGTSVIYSADGTVNIIDPSGYGGTFIPGAGFWQVGRVYQKDGSVGAWPSQTFHLNMRIVGTCFGIINK